jgi:purine-binding chemotaxis protein CheW
MASKPYLIFTLDDSHYAIAASLVKEIFPLPELTPVPEAPTDIIGILNLRSEVLPVMHLALRLGRLSVTCQLEDQIVVMDWRGLQIGMVVDRVLELRAIEDESIQAQIDYGRTNNINPAFIAGIAKLESELIVLLDPETLIRQPDEVASLIWEGAVQRDNQSLALEPLLQAGSQTTSDDVDLSFLEEPEEVEERDRSALDDTLGSFDMPDLLIGDLPASEESVEKSTVFGSGFGSFYDRFCPHATPGDREIFQQRAEKLKMTLVDLDDSTGLYPLAVVKLGGESFGIDLKSIQEFTSIRNLTAIPCCPGHIVGNMNLRGEIVTLVDIRSVLNLSGAPVRVGSKTVVVQVQDILAGLPVDDVADVMYVNPDQIKPVPVALPASSEAYLQGTVSIFDLTVGILNLSKLLGGSDLVVNETV